MDNRALKETFYEIVGNPLWWVLEIPRIKINWVSIMVGSLYPRNQNQNYKNEGDDVSKKAFALIIAQGTLDKVLSTTVSVLNSSLIVNYCVTNHITLDFR